MVKAVAGGGGRGRRVVGSEAELPALLAAAQHEAGQTFGCADVYVEKFIARPRHIEFQVLGDKHGNLTHLGERDCSIQRRHQKLLEESPSPAVSEEVRQEMGQKVVAALRALATTTPAPSSFCWTTRATSFS